MGYSRRYGANVISTATPGTSEPANETAQHYLKPEVLKIA